MLLMLSANLFCNGTFSSCNRIRLIADDGNKSAKEQ